MFPLVVSSQAKSESKCVRANVHTLTLDAPAFRKAFAHELTVAPVVITSSIIITGIAFRAAPCRT